MLHFLADENFSGDIVRGLKLQRPELDLVRVQDVALSGSDDPQVLAWAAAHARIALTHDRATMPRFAFQRVEAAEPMPGLFVVSDRLAVGEAIQAVLLVDEGSEPTDWSGRVVYLPL